MWIKICGLNDSAIARQIAELSPDAIGLNFYEPSVRCVTPETARQIAEDLPPEIQVIGVFAEAAAESIQRTAAICHLGGIQLHAAGQNDAFGEFDHRPAKFAAGPKRIRAFQVGARGLAPLAEYFERGRGRTTAADAYLVDAQVEGMYGGTGKTVSWDLLRNEYQRQEWPPLILAGGLRPENVGEAIDAVRPWGVDVASGVESSPGIKDVSLVARFIEEARRAFAKLNLEIRARDPVRE
ncbi:MAG TPA: phosphoribosylanthranilate isomerase [Planctomycetaceae bacterium]|jgi:phosphoribosylanthranilate isomerase|nr:phosphoribosylanthranilate isomerase [Planctomycetaceae bacterium]